jgi:hypothetical protein
MRFEIWLERAADEAAADPATHMGLRYSWF